MYEAKEEKSSGISPVAIILGLVVLALGVAAFLLLSSGGSSDAGESVAMNDDGTVESETDDDTSGTDTGAVDTSGRDREGQWALDATSETEGVKFGIGNYQMKAVGNVDAASAQAIQGGMEATAGELGDATGVQVNAEAQPAAYAAALPQGIAFIANTLSAGTVEITEDATVIEGIVNRPEYKAGLEDYFGQTPGFPPLDSSGLVLEPISDNPWVIEDVDGVISWTATVPDEQTKAIFEGVAAQTWNQGQSVTTDFPIDESAGRAFFSARLGPFLQGLPAFRNYKVEVVQGVPTAVFREGLNFDVNQATLTQQSQDLIPAILPFPLAAPVLIAVSYTHLTLPTICSV